MKQKKTRITVTIDPDVLVRIDESAEVSGLNRSQAVDLFIRMGLIMMDSIDKGGVDHGKITIC